MVVICNVIGESPRDTLLSVFQKKRLHSATCDLRLPVVSHVSTFTSSSLSLSLLIPPFIFISTMDVPEPNESPFTAVSVHTSKLTRVSAFPVRGPGRRNYSPILCTGDPTCPTRLFHTDPSTPAISILPRCLDSLHDISLGWYRCLAPYLLPAHRFCSRMVHRYVLSKACS